MPAADRRPGDYVVVPNPGSYRGLGVIESFEEVNGETYTRVRIGDGDVVLGLTREAASRLEPPMSRDEAKAVLDTLTYAPARPDERAADDRFIASIKAVTKGSWRQVSERLAMIYASPWKPTISDLRMIFKFEGVLFPMLAHALGRDEESIRDELHAGQPVFAAQDERPPAPEVTPETSPSLAGWDSLYPLELDGEIWIGERPDWIAEPDNGLVHLSIVAGRWHSYLRSAEDEDDDEDDDGVELLLVRESALAHVESAQWREAGRVTSVVRSPYVNVVDRTASKDEDTMDRVRYLGGVNAYGGRALCVATSGWDGPLPVLVSPPSGATTVVKVSIRD